MKKILNFLTSRVFITGFLLIFQLVILIASLFFVSSYSFYFYLFFTCVSFIVGVYILSKNDNPIYKIAWLIPVLLYPLFGGLLYFIFGKTNVYTRKLVRYSDQIKQSRSDVLEDAEEERALTQELAAKDPFAAKQSTYITKTSLCRIWQNTATRFLPTGEEFFETILKELEKAEKFIFLEYFIIEPGKMWDSVLEILARKVKAGVEVRFIYDDIGSIRQLPRGYDKFLGKLGIKVCVFNPFRPSLEGFMNNRDHRKILVIDGNVGYTGGINMADEYINAKGRASYWKDSALELKGEGVWGLTLMFLEMWAFANKQPPEYSGYYPTLKCKSDGYVLPFEDSPIDGHPVTEMTFINMINAATRYVYITTPYLILDHEMMISLCLCAQNGVDVRIIVPHFPDKWYVHIVTRSYYAQLISSGVKIYEFLPGFMHSKTLVVDDAYAVVGTTNFDFRSFYLHFECNVWMYKSGAVMQVYEDHMHVIEKSKEITLQECNSLPFLKKVLTTILRAFSPLL